MNDNEKKLSKLQQKVRRNLERLKEIRKLEGEQLTYEMIQRSDGQPLWDEALTLEYGTATVSPFVVLEAG